MLKVIFLFSFCSFLFADVFSVMGISSSGMMVQQQKLQAVAENIANMNAFNPRDGSPYKRKYVVVRTMGESNKPYVSEVREDDSSIQRIYDPSNPMSDRDGFVSMSGYSLAQEMTDMSVARRMYEANAAIFSSAKQTAQTLMNIGR